MPLPMTTPDGSTYRLFYSGACGVNGTDQPQKFDITEMSRNVRQDPTFADNFRVFVRPKSASIQSVKPSIDFDYVTYGTEQIPVTLNITLTSTDATAEFDVEAWYIHSIVR